MEVKVYGEKVNKKKGKGWGGIEEKGNIMKGDIIGGYCPWNESIQEEEERHGEVGRKGK